MQSTSPSVIQMINVDLVYCILLLPFFAALKKILPASLDNLIQIPGGIWTS